MTHLSIKFLEIFDYKINDITGRTNKNSYNFNFLVSTAYIIFSILNLFNGAPSELTFLINIVVIIKLAIKNYIEGTKATEAYKKRLINSIGEFYAFTKSHTIKIVMESIIVIIFVIVYLFFKIRILLQLENFDTLTTIMSLCIFIVLVLTYFEEIIFTLTGKFNATPRTLISMDN